MKGLIYGPNGRPMSPSHSRLRGRIYRYYGTREASADGYDIIAHSMHLSQHRAGQGHRTGAAVIGSPWRRAPEDAFFSR
jgi:hypothetical protein